MDFIDSTTKKATSILRYILGKTIFSWRLFADPAYQKWIIAIGLCLILSLILVPEIRFLEPKYEIGTISTKDIKADRDFLVEDKESTKQKKIDAAENVRSVYDYDSGISASIEVKIIKAINILNELGNIAKKEKPAGETSINPRELQKTKKLFEEHIGFSLSNEEFDLLINHNNLKELQNKLSRIVFYVYEDRIITNANFSKGEKEKGISLRNLKTQTEEEMHDIGRILNIKDIDSILYKRINMIFSKDDQDFRRNILNFSRKIIEPNLTFNKDATEKKKIAAMDEVKPVFFLVQKNEMIIREGEKISALEMAKLDAFLKVTGDNKFSSISVVFGIFCISLFLALVLYFWRTRNWLKSAHSYNVVDLLTFGMVVILQTILVKFGIFTSYALNRAFPFIAAESCYFAIPFAMGSMIIAILINRNVSLICSVLTSFLIAFLFEEKIGFSLYSFLGSVAASHQIVSSRQRSAFLKVGIFLSIINITAILCLNLLSGNLLNNLFWRLLAGIIGGILTGVLVAGITPIFETIFGYMTDIKLLELANLNQPIFQKMIIEAPGTYHHSIIVGSLVEAASEAIGADPVLAKVSAYYHDIGKLKKPHYFIENQPNNDNKHDKLSPKMSSLIIISHVKDGCELATEAKLGRKIINIIRESHGTSLVSYFYEKAKKDKDESIRSLSESDFRYPGPKPQTKEAGLVMLGDVVEASSRSLSNPTPARIRSLVRERIERVFTDGQLDECELTLKNLNVIAETFTRILMGIFHHRIDYPEQLQKDGNGKKENNENTDRK